MSNNQPIKLSVLERINCYWKIKRTAVFYLPEYQINGYPFKDNWVKVAKRFMKQVKKNRYNVQLYDWELDWIETAYRTSEDAKASAKPIVDPTPP